jgi:two-component system response regulator FixJ
VVVTGYADVSMAVQAMQAGAVTFLEKPCVAPEIQESILISLEKEEQLHVAALEIEELRSRLATLSDSEKLVLGKILEGKPNKVIKKELDIGLRTAELRRSNVMKKMQASSLAELVRMALVAGITTESSISSETDSHLVAD